MPGENQPEEVPKPPVDPINELRPERLFGSFELQRELDSGSTGATWLAHDYNVQRKAAEVTLKFLPDLISSHKPAFDWLKNEIRRAIALRHPNILSIYDLVENRGRTAIQMEYKDGQSLSHLRLTKPNQIFEVRDLEHWVNALCEALEYAHKEHGIVHGEIRPSNLIVDFAGNLKIKDFGTASRITDAMRRLDPIHGRSDSFPYDSPQRVAGTEAAITDDLYALGATFYELLTGAPPLHAGNIGAQAGDYVPPSMAERRAQLGLRGEAIPKIWEETVAACLAQDPMQRPQSASEVKRRLQIAAAAPHIAAKPTRKTADRSNVKPPPVNRPARKRTSWLIIVGFLFLLVLASAVTFFAFHKSAEPKRGRITLDSTPSTATVFLDGVSRGKTPLVIENVAPGDRQLRIELDGYEPQLLTATIKAGQEYYHNLRLVPSKVPAISSSASPSGSAEKESSTERPSPTPLPKPTPMPSLTPSQPATTTSTEKASASPSPTPTIQPNIDATREEVIKRIDALPGVTAEKKANLIEKMQKARSMERLVIIPFERGQISLRRSAADDLVKALNTPEMQAKLSDPTVVLVIAGYSDVGGRADLNLRISQERADNVSKVLKEQGMLLNAMQTIGMGGTALLDSSRPDQNRAVEVWAVVPF